MYRTWLTILNWITWLCFATVAAVWLAWLLLAQLNFAYPLWYEMLSIDETIAIYGPQNRNKRDFETTDKVEHERLFAALVHAIHHQGVGLQTLSYHDASGKPIDRLLTPPEIVHLLDVAGLVNQGRLLGWLSVSVWLVACLWLIVAKMRPPSFQQCIGILSGIVLIASAMILLAEPVQLFYQLHEWFFPQNHQWFFYYQDSLMTTLLKAPDIFAAIAILWLVVSILVWLGLSLMSRCLVNRRLAGRPV